MELRTESDSQPKSNEQLVVDMMEDKANRDKWWSVAYVMAIPVIIVVVGLTVPENYRSYALAALLIINAVAGGIKIYDYFWDKNQIHDAFTRGVVESKSRKPGTRS